MWIARTAQEHGLTALVLLIISGLAFLDLIRLRRKYDWSELLYNQPLRLHAIAAFVFACTFLLFGVVSLLRMCSLMLRD